MFFLKLSLFFLLEYLIDVFIHLKQINGSLDADLERTSEMEEIYKSLNDISEILGRRLDDLFYEQFNAEYKAPLKLDNKTFWEKVFFVSVLF